MTIKRLTLAAGPEGVKTVGHVEEVSDEMGLLLIQAGYAEAIPAAATPVTPTTPSPEPPSRPPAAPVMTAPPPPPPPAQPVKPARRK